MNNDVYYAVLMRVSCLKKDSHSTLYVKNVNKVL